MNKAQSERFRDTHLMYKYNLIHLLPSMEVPELSGLYLKSFYNGTKRYCLQLPQYITEPNSKFCGACGAVRVPSFNTQMAVVEEISENSAEISRALQYTCLHCNTEASLAPRKVEPNKAKETVAGLHESLNNKVGKKSSAKERAKKRKKSTLSNMLSQKNEEKKKNSFSLSLESFMQND
ncbi:SNM1 (YDR478W) [Zygosaccharomyces parabailii]|uniref:ZYBA0S03-10176g1_1 n=1 Tax=Zygosaccharomyces bailii (strain CLIB 213 / ATCC 58445 / CBS 680 / BCRC 21525 / NBRC 1098 / NCYC 1416 / NRRL Y-2227) TaxID=1333698 RepID=A0A8J2T8C4_ZYGB2|nr:SNM1 (YDR478W) [Zygosaccharomyces parabailii]CDF89143.1 ZYBA0S03-10176g1_1 [Zygosaccharomyces bailii CLIB 213]CDH16230.1 uncharacterized protein ZBAI_08018 [Zygosaccharomyces bailii ISA1307]